MDRKYDHFLTWRSSNLREENGILVGSDISQEWLLPWWWKNYRAHNAYPVAFVDFGMSDEKKTWCKKKGELIFLRIFADFVREKSQINPATIHLWEEETGNLFWSCRESWFKKPLACLQTPFRKTVWIDLDCEVRKNLGKLFVYADKESGLAMAKDSFSKTKKKTPYPMYNSGVIAFRRNLQAIADWGHSCIRENHSFRGDQEVFSHLIAEKKIPLSTLPARYNWSRLLKENQNAAIFHWHGFQGKFVIREKLNRESIDELSLG